MKLTGAEIVIECLKEQGVDTVFGYPGGTILNVYDALYKHSDEIRHILTSHEQGASHAADGYARATGKVGVCLATSGPGCTNLVTGIATAYMDSIPVVAITCNVGVSLLGKDTFQEVDIAGITMPITKYSMIVKDVNVLADCLRRAFDIARSGRPGPVLIDITKDVTAATCDYKAKKMKKPTPVKGPSNAELKAAGEMIAKAKRPMIFTGGGTVMSGASKELTELAHLIDAPVCDSLMGKGGFPGTDPLYMGMLGMHGTKIANRALRECDLLIAAGVRFSDRDTGNTATFAENATILQFDIDRAEVNKNINVDRALIGDMKETLQALLPMVEKKSRASWLKEIDKLKEKFPLKYDNSTLTGPGIMQMIDKKTNGEAIIVTDVGQHQMWASQYYRYTEPRTFLSSGGLGTMGYGLGAAIGAQVARPDKQVINIAGDGCFRMNMNELLTAARYNIPMIEVVINNSVLGMVRQWQNLFYDKRFSQTTFTDGVDFAKIADAMGVKSYCVRTNEEFAAAMDEALKADCPVCIECRIDSDDMVFPMAAPGQAIEEAFDQDDLNK
ncbi:MAG: biosynthetic-type acetolactate synthase large subunit [Lachnospiraceae bacterium]|nr:biosynthetic-type acetolactate synthase large subunit [Candidatus Equihabitans merdae]